MKHLNQKQINEIIDNILLMWNSMAESNFVDVAHKCLDNLRDILEFEFASPYKIIPIDELTLDEVKGLFESIKDKVMWPSTLSAIKVQLWRSGINSHDKIQEIMNMAKSEGILIKQERNEYETGQKYPKWWMCDIKKIRTMPEPDDIEEIKGWLTILEQQADWPLSKNAIKKLFRENRWQTNTDKLQVDIDTAIGLGYLVKTKAKKKGSYLYRLDSVLL